MSTNPKIALVAGSSGLVGGLLLAAFADAPEFTRVYALSRRPLGRDLPKVANRIVNFERLPEQLKGLTATDAFCCIGTTIADAGSQEAFRDSDVEAVLLFARAARAAQATRFVVVSSARAAQDARNFYLRTKGEMESAISEVGFPSVDILQPSLLLGARKNPRFVETAASLIAPLVNPMLTGPREALRAISAETVAKAMIGATRRGGRGVYRYTYSAIRQLADLRPAHPIPGQQAKKKPA